MSRSGAFCPRCGDEIPDHERERPSVTGQHDPDSVLCDACYFEEFDLVDAPDRIEVRVCAQCGAVHRGNRWVDVGAEDYTDIAVDEVSEALGVHVDAQSVAWQVAPEQVDKNTIRMHAEFSGVIRETPVTEEVVVPVKISRQTCTRCGKIAGGSYASTVQVRADERTPTGDEADRVRTRSNGGVAVLGVRDPADLDASRGILAPAVGPDCSAPIGGGRVVHRPPSVAVRAVVSRNSSSFAAASPESIASAAAATPSASVSASPAT